MNLFNVAFSWFGKRATDYVEDKADKFLIQVGKDAVHWARYYVPVDTGELQASIGFTYQQRQKRLTLHADTHYAYFVEYGTRFMLPQPFLRPAILKAIPANVQTAMQFGQIRIGGESIFGTRGGSIPSPKANAQVIKIGNRMNQVIDRRIGGRTGSRTRTSIEFLGRSTQSTPGARARFAGKSGGRHGSKGGFRFLARGGGGGGGVFAEGEAQAGEAKNDSDKPSKQSRFGAINWHRFLD